MTDTGESVYRYATEIFATGEEMLNALRGNPTGAPLLLRVGVKDVMPKMVAFRFLQPAFQLETPIRLISREGDLEHLINELSIQTIHCFEILTRTAPYGARMNKIRNNVDSQFTKSIDNLFRIFYTII